METFKQFLAKDIKIIPFTTNKDFSFTSTNFYTSSVDSNTYKKYVGINRFYGKNLSSSLFLPSSETTTGTFATEYPRLVYESIRQLYYSNYLTSSFGDPSSALPRESIVGSVHTPNYYNYLSSTLTASRYFPTASNSTIAVISIPTKLYGDYIQPSSFEYSIATGSIYDDGEGNLIVRTPFFLNNTPIAYYQVSESFTIDTISAPNYITFTPNRQYPANYVEQINYTGTPGNSPFIVGASQVDIVVTGIAKNYIDYSELDKLTTLDTGVFSFQDNSSVGETFEIVYSLPIYSYTYTEGSKIGNIIYEHGIAIITTGSEAELRALVTASDATCNFKSSYTMYETQYKCTLRESEYNYSLNPSVIKNNTSGSVLDFVTGSYFEPYITSVGLYDSDQNLLAVAKLAQPLQSSKTTDTTILINLDI